MAEVPPMAWRSRGAFDGIAAAGRHGRADGAAGVSVTPREHLGLAAIIAREGGGPALSDPLRDLIGVAPPSTPKVARGTGGDLVWSGPNQWLVVSPQRSIAERLTGKLAGLAAVSDQKDARAVLRLGGPRIREALAKGCLVDLHPRAFRPGDAASTIIAHVGVQLWQLDEGPTYDLAVFRSMSGSFWSWLMASSAEFGCEVIVASDPPAP